MRATKILLMIGLAFLGAVAFVGCTFWNGYDKAVRLDEAVKSADGHGQIHSAHSHRGTKRLGDVFENNRVAHVSMPSIMTRGYNRRG